ncbi:MAG: hypothetical protein IPJ60_06890 [Sphingobacteriaceae bacterium]|nr:hypothetical protein [Sphingobacteriaceae bacterium]
MEDISISPEAVKKEFTRSTERFHVITCWVGLLLNLVWFVSDIFVLPDHWKQFFEFRIAVSGIAVILLLTKNGQNLIFTPACLFWYWVSPFKTLICGVSWIWLTYNNTHLHIWFFLLALECWFYGIFGIRSSFELPPL